MAGFTIKATRLDNYISDAELKRIFRQGPSSIDSDTLPFTMSDKGILLLNGDKYQKIQVYRSIGFGNGIRVTSGWYESGTFIPAVKGKQEQPSRLSIDEMFMIGPGYREHIDITLESIAGYRLVLATFEPIKVEILKAQNFD